MQRPVSRNSEGEGEENPLGGLEATVSCLWVLTPLSATVSLVLVAVGMATNQWLHTTEKMSNPHYNGTGEKEYLAKVTVSGLWMFCFTNPEMSQEKRVKYTDPNFEETVQRWLEEIDSEDEENVSECEDNLEILSETVFLTLTRRSKNKNRNDKTGND
ncbi:unnamed protein product [Acanthoscelides obtectus]|uniref:Uncharacterized protein n=1 Tax=Acanthoscelides obtectus TaxID=200917 RepID=A0A9P0JMU8_ACAOB|nr:unnamed protein product [Acanthoscelides obtectus]CAK1666996.1 hypothetical protein AOBTE_LOCUS25609 [Acanthoscelides obtectus]